MKKTGSQIEQDFYDMIKGSVLRNEINGGVYKDGMRPTDSLKEDVIVTFVSGVSEQYESGVVNVNVFVPNINHLKNISRCKVLETIVSDVINGLSKAEYLIELRKMIQSYKVEEKDEHFVNVNLKFKRKTF